MSAETVRGALRDLIAAVADSDVPLQTQTALVGVVTDASTALDRLESALERIGAPKRPDGTYNLSREACEQIALAALD